MDPINSSDRTWRILILSLILAASWCLLNWIEVINLNYFLWKILHSLCRWFWHWVTFVCVFFRGNNAVNSWCLIWRTSTDFLDVDEWWLLISLSSRKTILQVQCCSAWGTLARSAYLTENDLAVGWWWLLHAPPKMAIRRFVGCRVFAIHGSRIVSPRLCVPSLTSWFLQGAKTFSYIFYPPFFFFFFGFCSVRRAPSPSSWYIFLFGFRNAQRPPPPSSLSASFLVWFLQCTKTSSFFFFFFFIFIFSCLVSAKQRNLILLLYLHLFPIRFCSVRRPPPSSSSSSTSFLVWFLQSTKTSIFFFIYIS